MDGKHRRSGPSPPPLVCDDLCLAFFSLLLLGRFPKSIPFDILFIFSPTDGQG